MVTRHCQRPVSYEVELTNVQLWKRHIDQLFKDTSQHCDSDIVNHDLQEVIDIDFPVIDSTTE